MDMSGSVVQQSKINKGQTATYLDVQSLYAGTYLIKIASGPYTEVKKIVVNRP